ncbi:MAG: HAMP domain-containing protein [Pseudomonadota bacterium]
MVAQSVDFQFAWRQVRRLGGILTISVLASVVILWNFYLQFMDAFTAGDLPLYFLPEEMETLSAALPNMEELIVTWGGLILTVNLVLVVVAAMFVAVRLGQPLRRVDHAIQEIGRGKLYTDIQLGESDEFREVAHSLNEAVAKIQLMIITLEHNLKVLEDMSDGEIDRDALAMVIANSRDAVGYFQCLELPLFEE